MRHQPRSPPPATPLELDDLLSEILLRLPPLPSSLPRASAVCKRWRSLASDPAFSRRFRRHHRRNPPLLGFFSRTFRRLISFIPTLEAPNRAPPGRLSLPLETQDILFLGCRHGLVLIWVEKPLQFLVWDPITGQEHRLAIPPEFNPTKATFSGAVLRPAAGDVQDFKVVLVVAYNKERRLISRVYSSETGVWGNLITTPIPSGYYGAFIKPAVLVGDSLYWEIFSRPSSILEFDLERESLSLLSISHGVRHFTVMRAEGGGLGFLSVSGFTAQLWRRKADSHGIASWEMETTIELDRLLSLNSDSDEYVAIRGIAEDNNLVFLYTAASLFTVQFESLRFKKLAKPEMLNYYHPFESVYAAGTGIGGGHGEAELLHNT